MGFEPLNLFLISRLFYHCATGHSLSLLAFICKHKRPNTLAYFDSMTTIFGQIALSFARKYKKDKEIE
jgi:hypothetical protein